MSVEKRGESRGDGVRVNTVKRAAAFRKLSCRDTSLLLSVLADNTKHGKAIQGMATHLGALPASSAAASPSSCFHFLMRLL
jgi:hypothetical protein